MTTIICIECGNEVDEGEALNGYCGQCVDKYVAREEAAEQQRRDEKHGAYGGREDVAN